MRITRKFSVKLTHKPNKQNLVRLAHLLIETTENTFEKVYFSFDDHGNSINCYGNEFTKNFFDDDYGLVVISSDWKSHGGNVSVFIYPNDECRVSIAADHLSSPEVNDLANELSQKIRSVLQPASTKQPPDFAEQNTSDNPADDTPKPFSSRVLEKLLRIPAWLVGIIITAIITAVITNLVNDNWHIISSWFDRLQVVLSFSAP